MEEQKMYKFLGELFEKLRKEEDVSIKQLVNEIHIGNSKYENFIKKGLKSIPIPL